MMKYTIMRNLDLISEELDFSISSIKKYALTMIAVAREIALLSKCGEGRQHACVLAVEGAYIVSTGYNGPAHKMEHCNTCNYTPSSICPAIHAEENAIINLARNGGGGTVGKNMVAYITKKPCKKCLEILFNAGITTLVF